MCRTCRMRTRCKHTESNQRPPTRFISKTIAIEVVHDGYRIISVFLQFFPYENEVGIDFDFIS